MYNGPDHAPNPIADQSALDVTTWIRSQSVPVYAVRGNHDVRDPYRWFSLADDVSARVVQVAEHLYLAGIGWHGERYYECPLEADLAQQCRDLVRLILRQTLRGDRVILLTHYPPLIDGLFSAKPGASVTPGYACITNLVQEVQPILVVQGHEHFWFRLSETIEFGARRCLVVNPGPEGMLVEIDVERGAATIA